MDLILPYKVGDVAESRTFLKGFRGAWFRCKIHDMRVAESGYLECHLEYIDYPEENKEWITLFQKNPACSKKQSSDQIMIRPSFPQWYWKDQAPSQIPDNDVAIVHESWRVGDMVDWFNEGCYWSAKITKLLNEDMLQVQLHKPPTGEGRRYDANRNDLRPTLDWSLLTGWTVPESQAKGKYWRVAEVLHQKSIESVMSDSEEETSSDDDGKGDSGGNGGDIQGMQISSSMSQKAPGSPIPELSSAGKSISSINAQDDTSMTITDVDQPLSPSRSGAPSDSVQPAVTSSQSDTEIMEQQQDMDSSNKDEQELQDEEGLPDLLEEIPDILEELDYWEQRLVEVERLLDDLEERRLYMDSILDSIGSFLSSLHDDASASISDSEDSIPVSEPA